MTPRQKRGIGFLISAAVLAVLGGFNLLTETTPAIVSIVLDGLSALLAVLGIPIVAKPKEY